MKIRLDFVTNSSSSSFILGKKSDNTTKDSVFLTIKNYYKEMFEKVEALKKDLKKWDLYYDEKRRCFNPIENKKSEWYKNSFEMNKKLEEVYGISTWDYFPEKEDWLKCKTYNEYEKYWLKRIKETKNKTNDDEDEECYFEKLAPFYIIDYENDKDVICITSNDTKRKIEDNWDSEELIDWYYCCASDLLKNPNLTDIDSELCEYCSCKKDLEKCLKFKENIKNKLLTEENAVIFQLGKIVIHSECGYIPEYVVKKLSDISEYSCNHMG